MKTVRAPGGSNFSFSIDCFYLYYLFYSVQYIYRHFFTHQSSETLGILVYPLPFSLKAIRFDYSYPLYNATPLNYTL